MTCWTSSRRGTRERDFERAVALCREAGLTLAPTFVAFTPWTTLEAYCALLQAIDRLGLVEHVAPIQLAIRLLITEGSRLLELPEIRAMADTFDPATLTYPWRHADPRVDLLQAQLASLVGSRSEASRTRDVRRALDNRARRRRLSTRPIAQPEHPPERRRSRT